MDKEEIIKIKQAIKWLTERIAELQCRLMPPPNGEDFNKYVEENKQDKVKRIEKILNSPK